MDDVGMAQFKALNSVVRQTTSYMWIGQTVFTPKLLYTKK